MNVKTVRRLLPKLHEAAMNVPYPIRVACVMGRGSFYDLSMISTNDMRKTHPILLKYNGKNPKKTYLHAEIRAIVKDAKHKHPSDNIMVVRVSQAGMLMPSLPCPMCTSALAEYGIKRVTAFIHQLSIDDAMENDSLLEHAIISYNINQWRSVNE